MGESAGDSKQRVDERLLVATRNLASFLTSVPLRNGTTARMNPEVAEMLAESVVRWQAGEVWDSGKWMPRGEVMETPEAGDVRVESLADGGVVKMTHLPTGITALGEDVQDTWNDLRRKVTDHG